MFDPYAIYKRQVHSSHAGQVIRKKIRRKSGKVYTNEELEDAIPVLRAIGYQVQKGNFYSTQFTTSSDTYILTAGSLNFADTSAYPLLFSNIWPGIKSDFQDCLAIDPLSVVNILFEIDLISIDLNGYQTSGTLTYPSISVYMFDPNDRIFTYPQGSPIPSTVNNFHVSFRAYSQSQYYLTESSENSSGTYWGYEAFRSKKESTDNSYLNLIERRQPAIIRALRDDDFNTFDPPLFYIFMGQAQQLPATISNSFITVQVKLIIEHK